MMNASLRVDAHHHVWDLTVRDQPWTTELPPLRRSFGFAELRPHLQTHDVDGTVLANRWCSASSAGCTWPPTAPPTGWRSCALPL
jgi:predicted TIM-barrel fold metal-dependent hydrolase